MKKQNNLYIKYEVDKVESLIEKCKETRKDIIEMIYASGSGHPGGSLSCVELLVALYHEIMNLNLDEDGKRIDKFILSKGHAAPTYYSLLAQKGYISRKELLTLRKAEGILEGHPSIKINGVDASSGSLGQGLSIANGMAIAKKLDKKEGYVYCLMGDGEIEEGQIWEAAMTAAQYKLNNLIAFVDYNGLQIDGKLSEVTTPEPIDAKFKAFGFNVFEIDGHNIEEIIETVNNIKNKFNDNPNVVILKTIKGKGISFMENDFNYHGKKITEEEYLRAKEELN